MSQPRTRVFYRLATAFPPPDRDYRTAREKRGDPPPSASAELLYSWDGLSSYDTEAGARRRGRQMPRLGPHIVRFWIPADSGIEARRTGKDEGHHDLRGSGDWLSGPEARRRQLEPYLDRDYVVRVEPSGAFEGEQR